MDKVHYEFIKAFAEKYSIKNKRVLEVGSWLPDRMTDENVRPLFDSCEYIGVDMQPGNNVDIVANGHELPFEDKSFDVVICMSTIEHDNRPFETVNELRRVCKDDGVCILTAPFYFLIHDFPNDYFRYSPEGIRELGKLWKNQDVYAYGNSYVPKYSMGVFSDVDLKDFEKEFFEATKDIEKTNLHDILRMLKWEFTKKAYKTEAKKYESQ